MKRITSIILVAIVASALIFVGCKKEKTPPVVSFSANYATIYAGESVSYTDNSTGSPTSWSWTFPGGTPSTSSLQNPVIVYESTGKSDVTINGTYDVTLSCSNADGNTATTKTAYITVKPNSSMIWNDIAIGQAIKVYVSSTISGPSMISSSNYLGEMSGYLSGAPSCGSSGNGIVTLYANYSGTLYLYAYEVSPGTKVWSKTLTLTPGCTQYGLTASNVTYGKSIDNSVTVASSNLDAIVKQKTHN